MTVSKEKYKGFEVEFSIHRTGFNTYGIDIRRLRFKGTKREEYFFHHIQTYSSIKKEARKEARDYIDNLKHIEWHSNGQMNNPNLRN